MGCDSASTILNRIQEKDVLPLIIYSSKQSPTELKGCLQPYLFSPLLISSPKLAVKSWAIILKPVWDQDVEEKRE